ncbi:MAG: c-type cytochrome [Wenzhouxiangellaceae bacterium]|nr:c-type cytochrome [Wenzhouxiangellaceae bacterium]
MKIKIPLAALILILTWSIDAPAFDTLVWPDGRQVLVVQPNHQIDLAGLKSGVRGHATDRRFYTSTAMYLANEIYLSGTEFFLHASERKLPIAHDIEFSFLTNVEAYWYSRYNLLSPTARARLGIGVVHGPYIDLLASEGTRQMRFGRSRGALHKSNVDAMLTSVVAAFTNRSGMPERFESAAPLMLEFKSGNPHFIMPVDLGINKHKRASYLDDFESLRWSHDRMDKTIDMGGVAQAMLKKILWAKFFLRRNHTDADFPGEVFLGNNAEDGFRGSMLTLESVSTMLMTKAALFVDPTRGEPRLTGINPIGYRPAEGLRYIPHEIHPTLIYTGDLPVRHFDLTLKDASSRLWDQASWLWAVVEYFDFSNPRRRDNWDQVFGYQTPYDGSIMEQKYALLAREMANVILANIEAMHALDGVLVSSWHPRNGAGESVRLADMALAMVGLAQYVEKMDLEPEKQQKAKMILQRQADFLLKIAAQDGSYTQEYSVPTGAGRGDRDMTSQAFAIRGLLVAHQVSGDNRYLEAARKTSKTWNREFWDASAWLYRNQAGMDRVVYTPLDVGAALAALREMALVDKDPLLLERFKKFFVQSVDASGLMQSEDIYTGEVLDLVRAGQKDSDGDGIPFMSKGSGKNGIDTVFAGRVEFDLSNTPDHGRRTVSEPKQKPVTGMQIFAANCAVCHGEGGVGTEGPKLIDNQFVQLTGIEGVTAMVTDGRLSVGMPAWGDILTKEEIEQVVGYIRGLK